MVRTRPQDVEEALDVALARLQRGEPVDSCLPADAALAGQLLPLLEVARELLRLAAQMPGRARALAAARKRFLREAARLRPHAPAFLPRQLPALFAPPLRRGVASTVVLVVLLVALLAGTTMMTSASASSLPGDPLYPVKRAAESVHLALTFDQDSRIALERTIEGRRIQEARAVLERRRQTTVTFRAVVESFEGGTLVASGLTVHLLSTTTVLGPPLTAGRIVSVVAMTQPEGQLVAQRIVALEATPTPRRPTVRATATHTVTAAPAVPPLATPQGEVTATATLTPSLAPGDAVTPTIAADTPGGAPDATATVTCTDGAAATCTPTPTSIVTAAPGAVLHLAGTVDAMAPGAWRVAGHDVEVSAETRVEERGGRAEVGAWVRVKAARQPDGRLVAQWLVVERPPGDTASTVAFEATIEEITAEYWVVGGVRVTVAATTQVAGEPQVGAVAAVEAARGSGGELAATRIAVLGPDGLLVEVEGTVEESSDGQWTVASRLVRVDAQTLILGEVGVGREVVVLGLEEPDGALRALLVRVVSWPIPSPTPAPAQTSTLTPTPLPAPQSP